MPDETTPTDDLEGAPPYDGRTKARGESKHGGEESVERQMAETHGPGTGATTTPMDESPAREDELTDDVPESPHGVGESTSRRGEDVIKQEGKERGRTDGPREHESDRPTGYSDESDTTSVG